MINQLYNQIMASFQNQFLAGGLGLMLLGWVGYTLRSIPTKLWQAFLYHCTVIVDVQSTDEAYHWLMMWLDSQPYGRKSRRVSIKDVTVKGGDTKQMLVPARGEHWFFYKGRPLWLSRNNDNNTTPPAGNSGGGVGAMAAMFSTPRESISIRMVGRKRSVVNALVAEAKALYEISTENKLKVYSHQWGDWTHKLKPKRPIESVYLPEAAEGLIADMRAFITSEPWYRAMGIPHRRGYLFYGPAGTGKSCSAEAIAGELDIPIYTLNLGGMSDASLEKAITDIENDEPIVLLLEDIDTVTVSSKRPETSNTPGQAQPILSLGTLLNMLDGLRAADNVLLIMTTNYPEKLDPALTRAGRVDMKVEFGMASVGQVELAVQRFLPICTKEQRTVIDGWERPISMAQVQENLKRMVLGGQSDEAVALSV